MRKLGRVDEGQREGEWKRKRQSTKRERLKTKIYILKTKREIK